MSEENNEGQKAGEQEQFKAITSQEELTRLIGERINKVKSQFADYDDIKAKAAEFDKAQEASKSELQKEREAREAAEKRATESERIALRTRIAAETNVPVEVLNGEDEDTIRASAKKILDWRDSNKRPTPEAKRLKSGSSGDGREGGSRAAAAVRALRNQ